LKRFRDLAAAFGIVIAAVCIAYASGGAGEGDQGLPWGNFGLRVANLVVFLGIIYYFAGKKIAGFFSSRRYNIETELTDLAKRKAQAEQKLKDVERNITNLELERKKILDECRAQGEALKASIIEKAKAQAEQITAQAQVSAAQETRYAVEKIRAEMADLVVATAEKMLQTQLTKDEHEKLIDKYLTKVVLN